MGKLENFSIKLNNPGGVCRAGEFLLGYVAVDLNAPMKMKGIRLRIKGETKVSFSLPDGDSDTTYKGNEVYFHETIALFEPGAGEDTTMLKAGPHSFDFELELPDSIPTSFESEFGSVMYSLECRIEKPWKPDHVVNETFSVINSLNLNMEKTADEPYHETVSQADACCFCYDNGDISVSVELPRRGYVPGESIPVTGEISNKTSGVVRTSVHLVQKTTYSSSETDRTKVSKNIINEIPDLELEPRNKYVFNQEQLQVPVVPPSRLDGCNFITPVYYLKVKARTDVSDVSCKAVADLLIGTEALTSLSKSTSLAGLEKQQTTAPLALPDTEKPQPAEQNKQTPPSHDKGLSGDITVTSSDDAVRPDGGALTSANGVVTSDDDVIFSDNGEVQMQLDDSGYPSCAVYDFSN